MQAQLARQVSWGNFMAPGGREKYRNSYLDGSWDGRREGVASTAGRPGRLWGRGTPKLFLTRTLSRPEANSPLRWPSARSQGPCWSGMWLSWHLVHLSSGRPLRPRNCLQPGCAYSPGPACKAAELGKFYGPRGKGEI